MVGGLLPVLDHQTRTPGCGQARYLVLDQDAKTVADTTVRLTDLSGVASADLAPLTAGGLQ